MITKLTGAATLFTAGALFIAGSPQLGATPVAATGAAPSLTLAGQCGSKDMGPQAPKDTKAPAKKEKAKDGSCGKGTCGSKDLKKGQKQGSCGKDKKEASCGKSK